MTLTGKQIEQLCNRLPQGERLDAIYSPLYYGPIYECGYRAITTNACGRQTTYMVARDRDGNVTGLVRL